MKTALICHHDDVFNRTLVPAWLASFSDLVAIVVIEDPKSARAQRVKREYKRSGLLGLIDVLLFQVWYRFWHAAADAAEEQEEITKLSLKYPLLPSPPTLLTSSPNSVETQQFLQQVGPDLVLARCKHLLKPSVYTIPTHGTFVLHPGTCPEYRNAHGCFWALVNAQPELVAATLLKIDAGVDTGPIYGYFHYAGVHESHIAIQRKVVSKNLSVIADTLRRIVEGSATAINTSGRASAVWGQPRLSALMRLRCRQFLSRGKRPIVRGAA